MALEKGVGIEAKIAQVELLLLEDIFVDLHRVVLVTLIERVDFGKVFVENAELGVNDRAVEHDILFQLRTVVHESFEVA